MGGRTTTGDGGATMVNDARTFARRFVSAAARRR